MKTRGPAFQWQRPQRHRTAASTLIEADADDPQPAPTAEPTAAEPAAAELDNADLIGTVVR